MAEDDTEEKEREECTLGTLSTRQTEGSYAVVSPRRVSSRRQNKASRFLPLSLSSARLPVFPLPSSFPDRNLVRVFPPVLVAPPSEILPADGRPTRGGAVSRSLRGLARPRRARARE